MARAFNGGSNQYLERSSFVSAYPVSISARVYPLSSTTVYRGIVFAATTGIGYLQLALRGDLAGDPVETYVDNGLASTASVSGYTANAWNHIGCVHASATSHKVYCNGSSGTDSTSKAFPAVSKFAVCSAWYLGTQYYDAGGSYWAEVGVWSTALSDADMAALADGITPDQVRPDALVAYYPLGGLWGDTDDDRWSGAHDLTPTNSPTWAAHPRTIYGDEPQVIIPGTSAAVATPWLYARGRSLVIGGGVS